MRDSIQINKIEPQTNKQTQSMVFCLFIFYTQCNKKAFRMFGDVYDHWKCSSRWTELTKRQEPGQYSISLEWFFSSQHALSWICFLDSEHLSSWHASNWASGKIIDSGNCLRNWSLSTHFQQHFLVTINWPCQSQSSYPMKERKGLVRLTVDAIATKP